MDSNKIDFTHINNMRELTYTHDIDGACYYCAAVCDGSHCSDCKTWNFIDQYMKLKNNIINN